MGIEIERKFLVKYIPGNILDFDNELKIYQNYLSTGNEELRIRSMSINKNTYYSFTIKKGQGFKRQEFEFDLNRETYYQILSNLKNNISLFKTRYRVYYNSYIIELDIYDQLDLKIAEVELLDENDSFTPPDWFGEEVTGDKKYSNQYLWEQLQKVQRS